VLDENLTYGMILLMAPADRRQAKASRKNGRLGGRPTKAQALLTRVRALYAELADKIQDIDPGDALLVIERMCRGPHDDRVFFIYPRAGGGYDF